MECKTEDESIAEVIKAARTIQEFLWGDVNDIAGFEEYRRMFRKRVYKIEKIDTSNPYWKIELRKRLLQTAAIAVNLITKLDNGKVVRTTDDPDFTTNLPEFTTPVTEE